jgi:hypothetical protein
LFDGSAVETTWASATLRLNKGTEINLASDSMGTLHADRMVLQKGSSKFTASDSFRVVANGVDVIPSGGRAQGVVGFDKSGTLVVASVSGDFQVRSGRGLLLARVHAGSAVSFAVQSSGAVGVTGILSKSDGHYYVTGSTGMHEIVGKGVGPGLDKLIGKQVTIVGTIDPSAQPTGGAVNVIDVSSVDSCCGGFAGGGPGAAAGSLVPALIAGGTAAALLTVGIVEGTSSSKPASR